MSHADTLAKARAVLADASQLSPITPAAVLAVLGLILQAFEDFDTAMSALEPAKAAAAGDLAAELSAQLEAGLAAVDQLEARVQQMQADLDALTGKVQAGLANPVP